MTANTEQTRRIQAAAAREAERTRLLAVLDMDACLSAVTETLTSVLSEWSPLTSEQASFLTYELTGLMKARLERLWPLATRALLTEAGLLQEGDWTMRFVLYVDEAGRHPGDIRIPLFIVGRYAGLHDAQAEIDRWAPGTRYVLVDEYTGNWKDANGWHSPVKQGDLQ